MTEAEFEKMLADCGPELTKLSQFTKTGMAIAHALQALKEMEVLAPNATDPAAYWKFEAALTMFAISYGRLFASGNASRLDRKDIPDELKGVHDEIMSLRSQRYAHNDEHHSVEEKLSIEKRGDRVALGPMLSIGLPVDPLFFSEAKKAVEHALITMKKRSDKVLKRLESKTGLNWEYDVGEYDPDICDVSDE